MGRPGAVWAQKPSGWWRFFREPPSTQRFYVGTDARAKAEAAWAAFDALQRAFSGPFANSFANSATSGGADAAPPEEPSAQEITAPNRTRPGVIRTHDQGIMSADRQS